MNAVDRMRIFVAAFFMAAVLLTLAQTSALGQAEVPATEPPEGPYATGELVVTYEEDAPETIPEPLEEAAEVEEDLPEIEAEVVGLAADEPKGEVEKEKLADLKRALEKNPAVESVEYNYERTLSYRANDPGLKDQWSLGKAGFERAWNGERGAGARIAILDTGISSGHPDLKGRVVAQRDFVEGDRSADDANGHGTAVSGIAAARTDNGAGIAGACPECRLVVGKVMNGDGVGYDSDIAQAILWAVENDAGAINLSLGGQAESEVLKNAVDFAASQGVVVVAAAGNRGVSVREYPAAYPSVVAVASTDRSDGLAPDSNFGLWVDVAAPGVGVVSTAPGGYSLWSGTSMAAPHVAAQAALLSASGVDSERIGANITRTAKDLGPDGPDPYYGAGRIDASTLAGEASAGGDAGTITGGGENADTVEEETTKDRARPAKGGQTPRTTSNAQKKIANDPRQADDRTPKKASRKQSGASGGATNPTADAAASEPAKAKADEDAAVNEPAKADGDASPRPAVLPDTGGPALYPVIGGALVLVGTASALTPRPVRAEGRR